MARMTKKQRQDVEYALRNATRALEFIQRKDVAVCRTADKAMTTMHYTCELGGQALYPIDKEIGSDLCGLQNCVDRLNYILFWDAK